MPKYQKKLRGFLDGQGPPAHFTDPKDKHHEDFVSAVEQEVARRSDQPSFEVIGAIESVLLQSAVSAQLVAADILYPRAESPVAMVLQFLKEQDFSGSAGMSEVLKEITSIRSQVNLWKAPLDGECSKKCITSVYTWPFLWQLQQLRTVLSSGG